MNRPMMTTTLLTLWWAGCIAGSYLDGYGPDQLILQRRTHGGVAAWIGTELNAPTFSLYANGRVVYYQYVNGRRRLVAGRLDKQEFLRLYKEKLELDTLSIEVAHDGIGDVLPVTEFRTDVRRVEGRGVGLGQSQGHPRLERLNAWMDSIAQGPGREFLTREVTLFVKKITGDAGKWPAWSVPDVDLSMIGRTPIGPYDPNVAENSIRLSGRSARTVQKAVTQVSVYEKFVWKNEVYLVGYRPELP